MKHLSPVTIERRRPAKAESILAKQAQLNNVFRSIQSLQEVSDLLRKDSVILLNPPFLLVKWLIRSGVTQLLNYLHHPLLLVRL